MREERLGFVVFFVWLLLCCSICGSTSEKNNPVDEYDLSKFDDEVILETSSPRIETVTQLETMWKYSKSFKESSTSVLPLKDESDGAIGSLWNREPMGTDNTKESGKLEASSDFESMMNKNHTASIATIPKENQKFRMGFVYPAIRCDFYDVTSGTCWLERQLGVSFTIAIAWKGFDKSAGYHITWYRQWRVFATLDVVMEELNPEDLPSNVAIGSNGCELRLSPLTDVDMDYNSFKAIVARGPEVVGSMIFRVILPAIEMGRLFPGQEVMLQICEFLAPPSKSAILEWKVEITCDSYQSLPSNVRAAPDGFTLYVEELAISQKGMVIVCGIFSEDALFIAKRRFRFLNIREFMDER